MIRAEGITKIFGDAPERALALLQAGKSKDEIQQETGHIVGVSQASFEIRAGEIFVIMGLSGSGKSTLLRCINRLIEPTSGKIFLDTPDGESFEITALDEKGLREVRTHRVSMVFQHFALLPHRTVLSNVMYGLEIQGRERRESERIAQEVLELVGLGQWGESYPSELSGGMQQRVGLARALATQAQVLLMDEPFSALDPLIKVQMQNELINIQKSLGRTIVFITHDLDEAMRIGDKIAIMESGVIVQIGSPEEILVNPKTAYVADFVEHADPTAVLTAGTIALPLESAHFTRVGSDDSREYFARRAYPEVQYAVDGDGQLSDVLVDGEPVALRWFSEVFDPSESAGPERRAKDTVLVYPDTAVIRHVLQGRAYSSLPIVVVAEGTKRVRGIIDESELIGGILQKKGYRELEAAKQQRSARSKATESTQPATTLHQREAGA